MTPLNPPPSPPADTLDEVRQLNAMFLTFLRESSSSELERFGLNAHAIQLIRGAGQTELERAAGFPRALFRLHLPAPSSAALEGQPSLDRESRARVLALVLLQSARSLSRSSGYWGRLLLRLRDHEVDRLRAAEVDEIVALSRRAGVVRAASGSNDWIWPELLTEERPEVRRRLLLIGFQPDLAIA